MQQFEKNFTLDKLYCNEIDKLKFHKIATINNEIENIKNNLYDISDNNIINGKKETKNEKKKKY